MLAILSLLSLAFAQQQPVPLSSLKEPAQSYKTVKPVYDADALAYASVIGFGAGHFYTREYGKATGILLTEVACIAMLVGAQANLVTQIQQETLHPRVEDDVDLSNAVGLIVVPVPILIATHIFEKLDAPKSARRMNKKRGL